MSSRKRGCCFCSHSGCWSDTLQLLNISSVFCFFNSASDSNYREKASCSALHPSSVLHKSIWSQLHAVDLWRSTKTFLLPLTFISKFILALRGKFLSDNPGFYRKFVQLSVVLCTTQDPVWSSALQSRQQVSGEGERYLPVLHHSTLPGRMSGWGAGDVHWPAFWVSQPSLPR